MLNNHNIKYKEYFLELKNVEVFKPYTFIFVLIDIIALEHLQQWANNKPIFERRQNGLRSALPEVTRSFPFDLEQV